MPEFPINSPDDPRLDPYRDLKQHSQTVTSHFIAEGEKLVLRLLASDCRTASIVCTEAMRDRLREQLPGEVPIYVTSTPVISKLIGFQFHRGILACGQRAPARSLESLWQGIDSSTSAMIVACPEIRDPENLGTIIRTAAAFGALGVIAGEQGTDPFSRRVLRTSMGTVLRLPIVQTDNWNAVLESLHAAGFESFAAVLNPSARPLSQVQQPRRVALLLGNEDSGLPDDLARACRHGVTMPMADGVDSLNVAVAAGILMHHFARPLESRL